jgi:hypothetical protein
MKNKIIEIDFSIETQKLEKVTIEARKDALIPALPRGTTHHNPTFHQSN